MYPDFQDVSHATEFLRQLPPFDELDAETLGRFAGKIEAAYYSQGKVISASRSAGGLAIIRKGAVRLLDDQQQVLEKRSEGEFFGHDIYFHGELKAYSAEAEEDTLLWHLSPRDFALLRDSNITVDDYFDSQLRTRLSLATPAGRAATEVRDLLKRRPVMLDCQVSIREAAEHMSDEAVSSVLLMREQTLCGIVTDKDLRRRVLATGLDSNLPIEQVMTQNPEILTLDAGVDDALLLMMQKNCHHLPIVDQGRPVGLVTAGDLLRSQSEHPLRLVRDIYKQKSIEELLVLSERLPPLFERMVNMGRNVEQIGRMITHISDAFTVGLIQFAEQVLGPAPMSFAWVAFGSQAREEQTAKTDQDNGLVLGGSPNEQEAAYFEQLARLVCDGLNRLGYVYCPGAVMAMNSKWRKSLDQWKRQFDLWIDEPDPKSVMHCSIFFDIRCIHGNKTLVDELQNHASARARENHIFLRFMAANVILHRPPLGFFRRFVQEDDGSHSEGLNLKKRGIVPIVDLVRMRALEGGFHEPNTFRRIALASAGAVMNEEDAGSLQDALRMICRIRLEHQAKQMGAEQKPSHHVPVEDLSPLMRRNLKAAFTVVVKAQNALALRYQLH
jgi:CBS domain-containing protein